MKGKTSEYSFSQICVPLTKMEIWYSLHEPFLQPVAFHPEAFECIHHAFTRLSSLHPALSVTFAPSFGHDISLHSAYRVLSCTISELMFDPRRN